MPAVGGIQPVSAGAIGKEIQERDELKIEARIQE
jgi:hypothetical protein